MTKATFDNYVSKLKASGVTEFVIRAESGNKTFYHNEETGKLKTTDTYVVAIELDRNYAKSGTRFTIEVFDFDDIDAVLAVDVPFATAVNLVKAMGVYDDEVDKYFKNTPVRMDLRPGTAGLEIDRDSDGNPILGPGTIGLVTPGHVK